MNTVAEWMSAIMWILLRGAVCAVMGWGILATGTAILMLLGFDPR